MAPLTLCQMDLARERKITKSQHFEIERLNRYFKQHRLSFNIGLTDDKVGQPTYFVGEDLDGL